MLSPVLHLTFRALLLRSRCGELGTCLQPQGCGCHLDPRCVRARVCSPTVTPTRVRVAVPSPSASRALEGLSFPFLHQVGAPNAPSG